MDLHYFTLGTIQKVNVSAASNGTANKPGSCANLENFNSPPPPPPPPPRPPPLTNNVKVHTPGPSGHSKKNLNWLWILLGCIGGVILIGLIIFLVRKKKKGTLKSRLFSTGQVIKKVPMNQQMMNKQGIPLKKITHESANDE